MSSRQATALIDFVDRKPYCASNGLFFRVALILSGGKYGSSRVMEGHGKRIQ